MSKPWDNEPTPIVNVLKECIEDGSSVPAEMLELAENLERRLRHAERLLERFRRGETSISAIETLHNDNIFHLEAARQEDWR